jgi:two-component system, NtrC family, sensor kinase
MGRDTKTVDKPAKKRRPTGATIKLRRASKPEHADGPSVVNRESRVVRLTRELREALERQAATADILQIIASSPSDVQPVFDALADRAMRLLDCWSVIVTRFDGEYFQFGAARGALPDTEQFVRQRYRSMRPDPASLLGRCLSERTVVSSADALAEPDPQLRDYARKRGLRAVLIVPLLRDDKVEGALVLTRAEPGLFAPSEIELVKTFADQAVIAIQNARLFGEVQARTRDLTESLQQQTATAEVLKVISRSTFDLPTVLNTLVESAAQLCDADKTQILRPTGEGAGFYSAASCGHTPAFDAHMRTLAFPAGRGSVVGRVQLEGKSVQIIDVLADPEYTALETQKLGGYRTHLGVPLLREGSLVGVLIVSRITVRPFEAKHIELVETFADQAVIAIENVRLFNEVKTKTDDLSEALQMQTATSDVLKVISRSAFDLQAVFNTLVTSAVELGGALTGTICVRDGDVFRYRDTIGAEHTSKLAQYLRDNPATPGRSTIAGRVLLSGEVERIPDCLADPEYVVPMGSLATNVRSLLGVPLLRNEGVEGAIILTRGEPGHFTDRQVEIVQVFADQAVIALENVRLFEQVRARTKELAASLDDLQKAQDRLVQTEKLASLGQLTAGIAHEIKNPLNFVNNFSALSAELVGEMNDVLAKAALDKPTRDELDDLAQMLKSNLEKVVQHGKRADSIVKNMLQHSREGSGEHRPADINAIVDESLNLAYHGARSEKAGFNIALQRDLDPSVGMADVYPQEITRVLLNLISNGFYATTKRKAQADDGFEPLISVTTKNLGDKIEVRVRDNGTGIPAEVKEKIFNPFFTTKPAGEGTGLGLSMSHDIIVKQHGGSIDVETEPGLFTEFKIVLPRTSRR